MYEKIALPLLPCGDHSDCAVYRLPMEISNIDERRHKQERRNYRLRSSLDRLLKEKLRRLRYRQEHTLTVEMIHYLLALQHNRCVYTGAYLIVQVGGGLQKHSLSFDRFDTTQGYVWGNVVLCSNRANSIKRDLTLQELRVWIPSWYERGLRLLERIADAKNIVRNG
jgi:hypothetical protein